MELEQEEIDRRRKLTDEERLKEDEELVKQGKKKGSEREKGKMQFMQKYYHKGAFYMDDDTINKTKHKMDPRLKGKRIESLSKIVFMFCCAIDYTEAVERDRRNADVLPEVMQRRGAEFGKKGGTKWTHLVNEDTSNLKDSLFYQGERERKDKKK